MTLPLSDIESDPFAEDPIQRDQWGRPKIIPLKRNKPDLKGKLVGYTRISTLAGAMGNQSALTTWRMRHVALGLGRRPDLAEMAGVFGPTLDDCSKYDKAALDAIIEQAHDYSGGNEKAHYGTTIHALTEPDSPGVIPERMQADVDAYNRMCNAADLAVVDTEQFVVNDEVQAAGTYDHRVMLKRDLTFGEITVEAGTVLVLDKKTGTPHFEQLPIQLWCYAAGKTYDPDTGERTPLEDTSTEWGLLAHIPKGKGQAELHLIDLTIGRAAALLAVKVMEHVKGKGMAHKYTPTPAGAQIGEWVEVITDESHTISLPDLETLRAANPAMDTRIVGDAVLAQLEEARVFAEQVEANKAAATLAAAEAREQREADALKARAAATQAAAVAKIEEDERQAKALLADTLGATPVLTIEQQIAAAQSRDELAAIYHANTRVWSDKLNVLTRARDAALKGAA